MREILNMAFGNAIVLCAATAFFFVIGKLSFNCLLGSVIAATIFGIIAYIANKRRS